VIITFAFIADFATPFPSEIFVGLMGLPQEDRETFLEWKDAILRAQPHETKAVFETVKVELVVSAASNPV